TITNNRHKLEGMCVNTIVFTSPTRLATKAAARNESALSRPDQKKNRPAAASESPKCVKSHNANKDWARKPPAKESRLNNVASSNTRLRDCLSGCGLASPGCAPESGSVR